MKKAKINRPKQTTSFSKIYNIEQGDINLDQLNLGDKGLIEMQLREIDTKIEEIGKICDTKKQRSYDDYNNVLKANKAQFMDELTQLNFKLIETLKHNTREDLMHKLKRDLYQMKHQVSEKDKELHSKLNILIYNNFQ